MEKNLSSLYFCKDNSLVSFTIYKIFSKVCANNNIKMKNKLELKCIFIHFYDKKDKIDVPAKLQLR